MQYAQLAEAAGFEAVWQAESRLVREATVPMAAYAAVTERIAIGSGVVNNWTRNVGLLAATFSTLDDLAPGRVKLGIGAWWEPLAAKVGHPPRASRSTAMRETVEAVRRLLAMERVTFHGEFVHLDDVEIDIVHGDRSPKHVPIYIGATAMKMMELAGEIGDGVVLNYLVGPAYNAEAMEHLAIGAERGGRSLDDVDRPQLVVCSLDDGPLARARPRPRARDAVPRPAAAHHEGERRRRRTLLEEIGRVLTWPATPRADRAGDGARPRRGRAADHRLRNGGRVPRKGAGVRRRRLHVPRAVPARRRRRGDDRRVRGGDCVIEALQPRSLEEALAVEAAHPEAVPVAGGTDLMVEVNFGRVRPAALLDLSRVEELRHWRQRRKRHLFVGAGMTFARIARELDDLPAARRGRPLRRLAADLQSRDVGGNVATASPAGDACPCSPPTRRTVVVASLDRTRRIPLGRILPGAEADGARAARS